MKKFKYIILSITLALMLSGVGYAAWNDSLAVSSTVKTGEADMKFVQDNSYKPTRGCEYVVPSAKINDDKAHVMEVTLDNMYPGSWGMFKVKGINNGTIPTKIDGMDIQFSGDKELLPYLTFEAGISIDSNGDNQFEKTCFFEGKLMEFADKFNEQKSLIKDTFLEPRNVGSFYLGVPANMAGDLEKKGLKDDYVIIKLSKDTPNELQKRNLKFTLAINFKQFNE